VKNLSGILLVELPPWDPRTVPLGIAYLATYLKSKGINAEVFDLNIEMLNAASRKTQTGWGNADFHWWSSDNLEERYASTFEGFADKILSFDMPVIGFSTTIPSVPFLNHLLKYIRKKSPDRVVVVGGPATFFPETRAEFDKRLIDYIVIGDGEIALYKLLSSLDDKGRLPSRVYFSRNFWKERIFDRAVCVQMPKIRDIDNIPVPTFEEFDLSSYTEGCFTLPIIFSKGCNRCCTFCSDVVLSNPYRCREASHVVREIKIHLKRYSNIDTFRLNDLSFNANWKFIDEFCNRVIAQDLRIKWYGQAQVRNDMNAGMLLKMRKAGCTQFSLGLESFSDRVLSMMRKGYTAQDAVRFLKASKDAGIDNHIAIIVGYPGETEEDFDITLKYINENKEYIDRICSLNICGMPVGSELRKFQKRFNYFFPPNSDWVSLDYTNTYEIRKRRYNNIIRFCNEQNIPVDACLDLEIFEKQFEMR
jgi:anaerobic magnesium-protoporphyrin IX monomethyl ester cyclase